MDNVYGQPPSDLFLLVLIEDNSRALWYIAKGEMKGSIEAHFLPTYQRFPPLKGT